MRVKGSKKNQGIALLMTLSIILFVSVALMKTFESRSVEMAHLGNTFQRFQAETLSRSALRTILMTIIKSRKLSVVMNEKDRWQGIPFPIENGIFQINEIKSIDHYFNFNAFRYFDPNSENSVDRIAAETFRNMVNQYTENQKDIIEIFESDINAAMSGINDWTDIDQDSDQAFGNDFEQYPQQGSYFEVKNRDFDRISELKMIPSFQKLGLPYDYLKDNFRVIGLDEPSIDINLATVSELESFLERYEGIDEYKTINERRSQLVEIIETVDKELKDNIQSNPFGESVRFPPPLYGENSVWKRELDRRDISLGGNDVLFSADSEYLRIEFSVKVDRITINAESIVKLVYPKQGKDLNISQISIIEYTLL